MIREQDVMKELKISRPTLSRWKKRGLPFLKVGALVFFEMPKVHQWLRDKSVMPEETRMKIQKKKLRGE